MRPVTLDHLEASLDHLRRSPRGVGTVELIVRRPELGDREVLDEATLHPGEGLVGDNWRRRGSATTEDGSADPAKQVTLMNSRYVDLVAGSRERWPLAGDQLYVDFDLSVDHLPPGTRVRVGSAVIEVSRSPHTGCSKFKERFGADALRFVATPEGRRLRLRGMNARVLDGGRVRAGDPVTRL